MRTRLPLLSLAAWLARTIALVAPLCEAGDADRCFHLEVLRREERASQAAPVADSELHPIDDRAALLSRGY